MRAKPFAADEAETGALQPEFSAIERIGALRQEFGAALAASAHQALAANAFLGAIVDSLAQGVMVLGPAGEVLMVNPSAQRLLALDPARAQAPRELAALAQNLIRCAQAARDEGEALWPERDYLTAEGRILSTEVTALPHGASLLTLHDITGRRSQEAALQEAEARFRALYSNPVVGLCRSSISGRLLFANPAFIRMNGCASEQEVLQALNDIASQWYVNASRRDEFRALLERDGRVEDFVSEVYRVATRESIWVSEAAWLVRDAHGAPLYYEATIVEATTRIAAEKRMRHLAHYDAMTGLLNRVSFLDRLEESWTRAGADKPLAVLCIDLDGFKQVNDSLGHHAGDQLLVEIGQRLRDATRASDHIARMGGDEFAMLLPRSGSGPELLQMAQRIIACVARPILIEGQPVHVGATIGIARRDAATDSATALMKQADAALYKAKRAGRGRACLHAPERETAQAGSPLPARRAGDTARRKPSARARR